MKATITYFEYDPGQRTMQLRDLDTIEGPELGKTELFKRLEAMVHKNGCYEGDRYCIEFDG